MYPTCMTAHVHADVHVLENVRRRAGRDCVTGFKKSKAPSVGHITLAPVVGD